MAMKLYIRYDNASGRITGKGVCQAEFISEVRRGPDQTVMEVDVDVDVHTKMVNIATGEIVDKPVYAVTIDKTTVIADNTDEITLTGLPVGCTVTVAGPVRSESVVNDGEAQISFYMAGQYIVRASTELGDILHEDIEAVEA